MIKAVKNLGSTFLLALVPLRTERNACLFRLQLFWHDFTVSNEEIKEAVKKELEGPGKLLE